MSLILFPTKSWKLMCDLYLPHMYFREALVRVSAATGDKAIVLSSTAPGCSLGAC